MKVNPDPFTLRELIWMYEGCSEFEWSIAASVMATNANYSGNTKRAVAPVDFMPESMRRAIVGPQRKMKIGELAGLLGIKRART